MCSVKGYAPRYVSPDSAGKDTCIAINPTELSLILGSHIRMKDDAKLSKVFYDLHMCTLISEPIHIINTHTHTPIIQNKSNPDCRGQNKALEMSY